MVQPLDEFANSPRRFRNADDTEVLSSSLLVLGPGIVATREPGAPTATLDSSVSPTAFAALVATVSAHSAAIAALQADVGALEVRVDAAETAIAALQGDVSSLQSDVSALQTGVSTLQSDVSSLQGDVSSLQTDVGTLQTAVANVVTFAEDQRGILVFAASTLPSSTTPQFLDVGDHSQAAQNSIIWGVRFDRTIQLSGVRFLWHTNGVGTGKVRLEVYLDNVATGTYYESLVAGTDGSTATLVAGSFPIQVTAGQVVSVKANFTGIGTYTTLVSSPSVCVYYYAGAPIA